MTTHIETPKFPHAPADFDGKDLTTQWDMIWENNTALQQATKTVEQNLADTLGARTFTACTGELGSQTMAASLAYETYTQSDELTGEIDYDPESPCALERERVTIIREGAYGADRWPAMLDMYSWGNFPELQAERLTGAV